MITIQPEAKVALGHGAYMVVASEGGTIAAVSMEGAGTLLARDLTMLRNFNVPLRPSDMALSADGREMAIAAADGITLYACSTFEKTGYLNDAYQSCLFGTDGLLWTCRQYTPDSAVLEIWDARREAVIAEATVVDPFGDSAFRLFRHPAPNTMVVWAAAGQDGQRLFWASLEGSAIRVSMFEDLDFTSPPGFRRDGREFLIGTDGVLYKYSFPEGSRVGEMGELVEDDSVGDFACYLDAENALVASNEGRLFAVDLARMEMIDEVEIEGAPDLSYFFKLNEERVLSIHGNPEGGSLMVWRAASGV